MKGCHGSNGLRDLLPARIAHFLSPSGGGGAVFPVATSYPSTNRVDLATRQTKLLVVPMALHFRESYLAGSRGIARIVLSAELAEPLSCIDTGALSL
jgi:hypothetical protein